MNIKRMEENMQEKISKCILCWGKAIFVVALKITNKFLIQGKHNNCLFL